MEKLLDRLIANREEEQKLRAQLGAALKGKKKTGAAAKPKQAKPKGPASKGVAKPKPKGTPRAAKPKPKGAKKKSKTPAASAAPPALASLLLPVAAPATT